MESKFAKHVDRDEIVDIVCELVRHNTVNPPGNEYLCKDIVTRCITSLGMEVSYYEKEPGRTNIVGRIGSGGKSKGFVFVRVFGLQGLSCRAPELRRDYLSDRRGRRRDGFRPWHHLFSRRVRSQVRRGDNTRRRKNGCFDLWRERNPVGR